MSKLLQLMAVLVMVTALAASGFARPAGDNGGKKGKSQSEKNDGKKASKAGKAKGKQFASESIGEIVILDERIFDLTGDYSLTSGTDSLDLSLVQDERGRLVGTADLALADLITTVVDVKGRIRVQDFAVTFTLEAALFADTEEEDDPTTTIRIIGGLVDDPETDFFNVVVEVTSGTETTSRSLGSLVPVNPLRGITIGEAEDEVERGHGRVIFSERLVTLPTGTDTVRSHQVNTKKGFILILHGDVLHGHIRGDVDDEGNFVVESVRLNLGFGNLVIDPDDVQLPAVQ